MSYTYLLYHIPTNLFYYGVKWEKGCHPDTFWKDYFTSSCHVALLRTLFGDESFEFEIRRTFEDKKKAQEWEHKVLRRMKVLHKPDVWMNRTDNRSIFNTEEMIIRGQIKRIETLKRRGSLSGNNNPMFGIATSNYQKIRVSEVSKKLKWYTNGVNNIRLDINEPAPNGWWNSRTIQHDNSGRFV